MGPIQILTMPPLKKRKTSHGSNVDKPKKADTPSEPSDSGSDAADVDEADIDEESAPRPTTFKELGIIDSLCEACESLGYKAPTLRHKRTGKGAGPGGKRGRDDMD